MAEMSLVEALLASLRGQAGRYPQEMRDIEISLLAMEFRRAFGLMSRLAEAGLWQPGEAEAGLLEDFWWEYCP